MDTSISAADVMNVVERYYTVLSSTGYVKQVNTARILASIVVLDFLNTFSDRMSGEEKEMIDGVYRKLHLHSDPILW